MSIEKEGTITGNLKGTDPEWYKSKLPCRFPPIEAEGISVKAEKLAGESTLELNISGPFGKNFILHADVPQTPDVHFAVTWEDGNVKLYLNGELADSK